ncbi:ABC transporter ATP-binding protein [Streptomyces albidus (ex Kaewkla and Franco 2022)]|uniref:ABC transporter ATP-binding protein n=1 Tax=Streptomyces albidus (ex Kaewkla and Franco 2022) TaxID=722709 RepID=UPI0015EF48C0|nr:ABC transporter ATP-binding protein [Streptomyces albidus (ex Kaewkla and Franco 2022)]
MTYEGAALEAAGLDMKYGRSSNHVLRDCSFRLPTGRICALVGANGAGKSTLLALASGLLRPAEGTIRMLGGTPAEVRERFAYVAQSKPLFPQLTVAETLRLGAELNPRRWDQAAAERIAYNDGPEPGARIRKLSGGQRTRVALALAFGKRAELLLLDEPMADLDPLARQRLTGALMAETVEHGTTIVMSSHVIAELEGACDYLFLLGSGRMRLAGECDEILAAHRRLTGMQGEFGQHTVIEERGAGRGRTALVRPNGDTDAGSWDVEEPSLEEVLLAHLRNPDAPDLRTRSATPAPRLEAAV